MKQAILAEGMPEAIADRMLDLERYYREGQANRITNDIKQVTGHEPMRYLARIGRMVSGEFAGPR